MVNLICRNVNTGNVDVNWLLRHNPNLETTSYTQQPQQLLSLMQMNNYFLSWLQLPGSASFTRKHVRRSWDLAGPEPCCLSHEVQDYVVGIGWGDYQVGLGGSWFHLLLILQFPESVPKYSCADHYLCLCAMRSFSLSLKQLKMKRVYP